MSTLIEYNGLTNGPIEKLYANLQNYTLDPINADYYDKLSDIDEGINGNTWLKGERPDKYAPYTYSFSGNFYRLSACFRVFTSDPVVISTLIDLIEANQNSVDFAQIKAKQYEQKEQRKKEIERRDADKRAEQVRKAKAILKAEA